MTDKEKTLAFIEERIKWNEDMMQRDPKPSDIGRIEEAKCIRRFINSLQEEPVIEGLEEASKNHAAERYRTTRDRELAEKCKWSFKAGAEWSKKHQAREEVLDVIEKELTRRMLEDYNLGVEEDEIERDEIAQGCMASLIMFVRQMKEE